MAGINYYIHTINIDDCLDEVNKKYGISIKFKDEQHQIIHALMYVKRDSDGDTFGFLLTGYDKSLT